MYAHNFKIEEIMIEGRLTSHHDTSPKVHSFVTFEVNSGA